MAFSHVSVPVAHGLYLFSSNLLQITQEEVCWVEPSRVRHPECFVVSIPAIVTWLGSSITLGPKLFATWILIMLAKPCVVYSHFLVSQKFCHMSWKTLEYSPIYTGFCSRKNPANYGCLILTATPKVWSVISVPNVMGTCFAASS